MNSSICRQKLISSHQLCQRVTNPAFNLLEEKQINKTINCMLKVIAKITLLLRNSLPLLTLNIE
ncbi:hypothetical protein KSF78_0003918 [Schistosoma japonicum]|nr:hypothetical protein KSF78_0003918 [Schistosoma japonicum]